MQQHMNLYPSIFDVVAIHIAAELGCKMHHLIEARSSQGILGSYEAGRGFGWEVARAKWPNIWTWVVWLIRVEEVLACHE